MAIVSFIIKFGEKADLIDWFVLNAAIDRVYLCGRKEFTEGFLGLKCDSIDRLKSAFKQIEADAMDNFKDLYRYTFQFALEAEQVL